ncbi:MAG: DUF5819 family protein [Flavobacteriales bacterium]|jgi:hypothetical protein|nr:DUF5819 family protein [Flavobacteriales bacterium]
MGTPPWARWAIIAGVAAHTALIAAYTLPATWVPGRARIVAEWYARPLFHQQWRLFAPDPPVCGCDLQVRADGAWRSMADAPGHLRRRAITSLCRYVQGEVQAGRTPLSAPLSTALRARTEVPVTAWRLVEGCVTDPQRPAHRDERITGLTLR